MFSKTQIPGAFSGSFCIISPSKNYKHFLFKTCALILLLMLADHFSYTQTPTLEWTSSYYNPQSFSYSMSKDAIGNIFICGYQRPFSFYKYLTLKFNNSGDFNWAKLYHTGDSTTWGIAKKCIADGIGNVFVGGTYSFSNDDIFIIKYNNQGDSIWAVRYNGSKNGLDQFADMVMDKFKNVYVTGLSAQLNTGIDFLTLKYDSTGALLWSATYNDIFGSTDEPQAIAIDSFQNVYVTGYGLGPNFRNEFITVKYNSAGVEQWAVKHDAGTGSRAYKIGVDRQNNIYVTGMVDSLGTPNHTKYRTLKYDQNGNMLWYKDFNSMIYFMNIPFNFLIDSSNSPIVVGTSIVKYNSSGLFIWADTVKRGYWGSLDEKNNLYIAGVRADTALHWYLQSIKYLPDGTKQWILDFGGVPNENYVPSDIVYDNNSIYISANYEYNGQSGLDSIVLLKYSIPVGIINNNNQIPEKFKLFQNFPNPFNPVTKIKFNIPGKLTGTESIELNIFDISGKLVKCLINGELLPGKYEIEWNAGGFASGVYFYRLKTSNYSETKKMMLIK